MAKSGWIQWTRNEVGNQGGVYVLTAGKPLQKLKKKDPVGILYIGQSDDLSVRLRVSEKSGFFPHSLLWYVASGPIEKNRIAQVSLPSAWSDKQDEWGERVWPNYQTVKDLKTPQLYWRSAPKPKELEDLLLIKHFFEYGQYPPFNASCPSIKSIYDNWEKRWMKPWNKHEIDTVWHKLGRELERGAKPSRK